MRLSLLATLLILWVNCLFAAKAAYGQTAHVTFSKTGLVATPRVLSPASTVFPEDDIFATYQVIIGPYIIHGHSLVVGPVVVDKDMTQTDQTAQSLLEDLRQKVLAIDGLGSIHKRRKNLRLNNQAKLADILYPHRSGGKDYHLRWHRYKRQGNEQEQKSIQAFKSQLVTQLKAEWLKTQADNKNQGFNSITQPYNPATASGLVTAATALSPTSLWTQPVQLGSRYGRIAIETPLPGAYRLRLLTLDDGDKNLHVEVNTALWPTNTTPTAEVLANQLVDEINPTAVQAWHNELLAKKLQAEKTRIEAALKKNKTALIEAQKTVLQLESQLPVKQQALEKTKNDLATATGKLRNAGEKAIVSQGAASNARAKRIAEKVTLDKVLVTDTELFERTQKSLTDATITERQFQTAATQDSLVAVQAAAASSEATKKMAAADNAYQEAQKAVADAKTVVETLQKEKTQLDAQNSANQRNAGSLADNKLSAFIEAQKQPKVLGVQLISLVKTSLVADSVDKIKQAIATSLLPAIKYVLAQAVPLPVALASSAASLLYAGEVVLPTSPERRTARVFIHDRGEGASASNRARYAICLNYSATDGSFRDAPPSVTECNVPAGYVGVGIELATLDRTAFVESLSRQLRLKGNSLAAAAALQKADSSVEGKAQAAIVKSQQLLGAESTGSTGSTRSTGSTGSTADPGSNPLAKSTKANPIDSVRLKESLRDLYDDYLRHQEKLYAAPRSGIVLLGQRIHVYVGRCDTVPNLDLFAIDSVQMEVEDGAAQGIKAFGTYRGEALLFETYAPIGLSSDYDLKKYWYQQQLWAQSSEKKSVAVNGLWIKLDELLRYYPMLVAHAADRSPADGVYVFRPQDPLLKRILLKSPVSKVLQARVFSDLAGISNDRPNGLIQVEIDKKFFLSNWYSRRWRTLQIGFVSYICPQISVNKIEASNRQLMLNHVQSRQSNADTARFRTVRTIDLLRYTNLRLGTTLNLVALRAPVIKSDFYLDASAHLGRVAIRDTLPGRKISFVDSTLTTLAYGLHLIWRIRPHPHYGAQFRVATLAEKLISDRASGERLITRIEQTPNKDTDRDGTTLLGSAFRTTVRNMLQYEILLWANVSDNSNLFFRTQFTHMRYQPSDSYFQLQVGYQFDVFSTRRSATMPTGFFPAK